MAEWVVAAWVAFACGREQGSTAELQVHAQHAHGAPELAGSAGECVSCPSLVDAVVDLAHLARAD